MFSEGLSFVQKRLNHGDNGPNLVVFLALWGASPIVGGKAGVSRVPALSVAPLLEMHIVAGPSKPLLVPFRSGAFTSALWFLFLIVFHAPRDDCSNKSGGGAFMGELAFVSCRTGAVLEDTIWGSANTRIPYPLNTCRSNGSGIRCSCLCRGTCGDR